MLHVFLLGRSADIIASKSKPKSSILWKDVQVRVKSMSPEGATLGVKARDHKGISSPFMQPLEVHHVYDARNSNELCEPIEIILPQAFISGQFGSDATCTLEYVMLRALEENDGVLRWEHPERPLVCRLEDPTKALVMYHTG